MKMLEYVLNSVEKDKEALAGIRELYTLICHWQVSMADTLNCEYDEVDKYYWGGIENIKSDLLDLIAELEKIRIDNDD